MENNKENKNKFVVVDRQVREDFYDTNYTCPTNKYNKGRGIIEWGNTNSYPNLLLNLYNHNGSPIHTKIINMKTKYTVGQGFEDILDKRIVELFKRNNMNREIKKIGLDYELFNGFAFKIVWNGNSDFPIKIQHVNLQKLRFGIPNDKIPYNHFWFSNNWNATRMSTNIPKLVAAYDEDNKVGTQLYYYSQYNPETDGLYPIPNYETSIDAIDTDYRISKFHNSNVRYGFAPSAIFKVNQNSMGEKELDEFVFDLRSRRAGEENAGKDMLIIGDDIENMMTMEPFNTNNSDIKFRDLLKSIESRIIAGSEIPPQLLMLYGGQLGSVDERDFLTQEFQNGYVTPRQNEIESIFNDLLNTDEIELKQVENIYKQNKDEQNGN